MNKIDSFKVDHTKLLPGIYVSRKDTVGTEVVTTYDIRMTRPNIEPVMNTAEIHTIEHLGATWLRNSTEWSDKVIYFGPMGCRTGFYLILKGEINSYILKDMILELFDFIDNYEGEVHGSSEHDCGNFRDLNLPAAKCVARAYISRILSFKHPDNFVYSE